MTASPALVHGSKVVALVVSMACVAAPAWAQDQANVSLTGDASQMCTLGQPTQDGGAQTNFDTPSGTVFSITRLADPDTVGNTRPIAGAYEGAVTLTVVVQP